MAAFELALATLEGEPGLQTVVVAGGDWWDGETRWWIWVWSPSWSWKGTIFVECFGEVGGVGGVWLGELVKYLWMLVTLPSKGSRGDGEKEGLDMDCATGVSNLHGLFVQERSSVALECSSSWLHHLSQSGSSICQLSLPRSSCGEILTLAGCHRTYPAFPIKRDHNISNASSTSMEEF